MFDSGHSSRQAPLPPVTTRWAEPVAAQPQPRPLAPPFVPGAPMHQPAPAMPIVPTFDSTPIEYERQNDAGDVGTMTEATQMNGDRDDASLPWEDNPSTADNPHAGDSPGFLTEPDDDGDNDVDEWPSAVEHDGQAVPAYGDEESAEDAAFSPPPVLNGEGTLVQELTDDSASTAADENFPLDAFIIPPDAKRLPRGLEHAEELHLEIAAELAKRLESIAQSLRREGFAGLLHHEPNQEPIDTLIAGVLAGYLTHQADS